MRPNSRTTAAICVASALAFLGACSDDDDDVDDVVDTIQEGIDEGIDELQDDSSP